MKDTPDQAQAGLAHLRLLAKQVPCQMCRIKDLNGGGYNIEPPGDQGCRHDEGMPIGEVVKRIAYAVNQSNNSRELARVANYILSLRVMDNHTNVETEQREALRLYNETEQGE